MNQSTTHFFSSMLSVSVLSLMLSVAHAEHKNPVLEEADINATNPNVSPARRIDRQQQRRPRTDETNTNPDTRTFDGTGNNRSETHMGSVHTHLTRVVPSDYADSTSALAGASRPSARAISNIVSSQSDSIPNTFNATDFLWQWGQFVDHDIDLTDGTEPTENVNIQVPNADPHFDPAGTNTAIISFNRSIYDKETGLSVDNPRQQLNEISAWIDASNVYGSDVDRANELRTLDGTGKLKTSDGNLLPFNTEGFPNAGGNSPTLFLAGDVRANEQVGLTTMHTLFVREHNRLASVIAQQQPNFKGDEIYQKVRKLVGAELQIITYREYLPILLGRNALSPYRGYKPTVDASISNLFSTASYRYGHSALSPNLLRLNAQGDEVAEGHLSLREAFFSPQRLTDEGGIDPILRGLATQVCQSIDPFVIDDVRNFLFGAPGSGGFDLVALNIQRGRDHGLPSYNDVRESLGLSRKNSFSAISSNRLIQSRLASAYKSVDDVDVWVGGLSEDLVAGGMVGELVRTVLIQQFEALRDGDRFWYQNDLSRADLRLVERVRLADVIRRNTSIGRELSDNVFRVQTRRDTNNNSPANPVSSPSSSRNN